MPEDLDYGHLLELDRKYVGRGYAYAPVIVKEARGSIVTDVNGKKYLDFIAGTMGDALIGHTHPKVVEAIREQAERFLSTYIIFSSLPKIQLAQRIAKMAPPGMNKSILMMSGSQGVETAIKAAMKATGRREVISLTGAIHGLTIGTHSLSQAHMRAGYPVVSGFRQIPPPYCYRCPWGQKYPGCGYECAQALEHMIREGSSQDVAAFVVEPIQSLTGHIHAPDKEYFKMVREICDRYGILLISDEWQAGLGRTGRKCAGDHFDLIPDIMVGWKGMGGGLPVAATIFHDRVLEMVDVDTFGVAFTHGGYPLGCAAGIAVIDTILGEGLIEKAARDGEYVMKRLQEMAQDHDMIGEVRGKGLFIGVELVRDRETRAEARKEAERLVARAFEKGLILMQSVSSDGKGGNNFMIKPPLTITREGIDEGLDIIEEALGELDTQASGSP